MLARAAIHLRVVLSKRRQSIYSYSSSSNNFSNNSSNNSSNTNLKGLPFSTPPSIVITAYEEFKKDNGINYFVNDKNTILLASFTPFHVFDFNSLTSRGVATAHESVPIYAGYNYRRRIANLIHENSLPTSVQDANLPDFNPSWLRKIILPDDSRITIDTDPWSSHKSTCWRLARQDACKLLGVKNYEDVQFELVEATRVYLPSYIFEYSLLNQNFRVCFSGCGEPYPISASDHKIPQLDSTHWLRLKQTQSSTSSSMIDNVRKLGQFRQLAPFVLQTVFKAVPFLSRFIFSPPFLAGAAFLAIGRKFLLPGYYERLSWEEDEKEKQDESLESGAWNWKNEIEFTAGDKLAMKRSARKEKGRRREREAREEQQEQFEREQHHKQQQHHHHQQQQQQHQQQQQQQQQNKSQSSSSGGVKFNFDVNNPYEVLGLKTNASKKELMAVFRTNMLKYHPDLYKNESIAKQKMVLERSKLITKSYQELRKIIKK